MELCEQTAHFSAIVTYGHNEKYTCAVDKPKEDAINSLHNGKTFESVRDKMQEILAQMEKYVYFCKKMGR